LNKGIENIGVIGAEMLFVPIGWSFMPIELPLMPIEIVFMPIEV